MTTPIADAVDEQLLYPDSDGQPMSENTLQYQWIVTIKGNLDVPYRHDDNVFVAGDLLWYAVKGQPTVRRSPRRDCRIWPAQGLPWLLQAMDGRRHRPSSCF